MPGHDIIVIGASAGGLETLQRLVKSLPAGLAASVFIVLHVSADSPLLLPSILEKAGKLPAVSPADKTRIAHGRIYVAPPDYHMLIEPAWVRIVHGPRENRHRPAIDPLFRSAGWAYGPRVIGVVLSGNLDDGTAGLWAVKARGGIAVVQDPADALAPAMPASAMAHVVVDHCVSLDQMGPLLVSLVEQPTDAVASGPKKIKAEIESTKMKKDLGDMGEFGKPTTFTCPSCSGTLWELQEGNLTRYRCHTGHAFSPESLLAEQSDAVEAALYSALRALEEKAAALRRITELYTGEFPALKEQYENQARDADKNAEKIRELLGKPKE